MSSDSLVNTLAAPFLSYWVDREGDMMRMPGNIFGPKVMLINETAGSGGDALPLYFRRQGVGQLIGKRTWGGLVGIGSYPPLLDGGRITAPHFAILSPEGEWEVENAGVPPDIEVEQTPSLVIAGQGPAAREGSGSRAAGAAAVRAENAEGAAALSRSRAAVTAV